MGHAQKSHLVAAVEQPMEEDPSLLAAIASRGQGGPGGRVGRGKGQQTSSRGQQQPGNNNRGQQQRQQPQQSSDSQSAADSISPSAIARMGSNLCYFHWSWGEKARNCVAPCGWQGN